MEEARSGPRGSEDTPHPGPASKGFQEAGRVCGKHGLGGQGSRSQAEGPGRAESRSWGAGGSVWVHLEERAAVSTGQCLEGLGMQGKALGCDPGTMGGSGRASWERFPTPKSDQACTPRTKDGLRWAGPGAGAPLRHPADPSYSPTAPGGGAPRCLRPALQLEVQQGSGERSAVIP